MAIGGFALPSASAGAALVPVNSATITSTVTAKIANDGSSTADLKITFVNKSNNGDTPAVATAIATRTLLTLTGPAALKCSMIVATPGLACSEPTDSILRLTVDTALGADATVVVPLSFTASTGVAAVPATGTTQAIPAVPAFTGAVTAATTTYLFEGSVLGKVLGTTSAATALTTPTVATFNSAAPAATVYKASRSDGLQGVQLQDRDRWLPGHPGHRG